MAIMRMQKENYYHLRSFFFHKVNSLYVSVVKLLISGHVSWGSDPGVDVFCMFGANRCLYFLLESEDAGGGQSEA